VELYRRNFLQLLRTGKSAGEAYYLSRIIGPVGDAEFGSALQNVRRTGYPRKRSAYVVERAAIWIWDLPGGIILTLLAFFASLFALVWATTNIWGEAGAGTILVVTLGLVAAGGLVLTSALLAAAVGFIDK
jgi:hypothetical protein